MGFVTTPTAVNFAAFASPYSTSFRPTHLIDNVEGRCIFFAAAFMGGESAV